MTLEIWLAYVVVETLLCLTPGPAVLFVASQAAWRGPRAGLAAMMGIHAGNAVYFFLAALGLAAAIAASATAFMVIKWAGAAYLAWLGIKAILDSFGPQERLGLSQPGDDARAFRDGVIVQLANPKAVLFFVALLPQFMTPGGNPFVETGLLWLTTLVIETIVLGAYVFAAGALSQRLTRPGVVRWLERGIGGVFLALAGLAAVYRRTA